MEEQQKPNSTGRKVLGIVMIAAGILVGLSVLNMVPKLLTLGGDTPYEQGYAIGYGLGMLLFSALAYALIRGGGKRV